MNHSNAVVQPSLQEGFSIPIKICDGLFMADRHISQDIEFFETNLITHVINCAGQEVSNSRKVTDVAFLTFDWSEHTIQNITEQKVVSVTVNFIEQCRRNAGCLLIHYSMSESRPFCLLACYFMIKFKWSLFKTLEFLNSRKEDVELEPAFFEQMTAFSQKLQEKGLIRSKIWTILPGMSDEEIIITNTYCNSKNKFNSMAMVQANSHHNGVESRKRSYSSSGKRSNGVSWKKDLVVQHVYCPNAVICSTNGEGRNVRGSSQITGNAKTNSSKEKRQEKQRSKSINNQNQNNTSSSQNLNNNNASSLAQSGTTTSHSKSSLIPQQNPSSEINVTKKWAELRQMWLREKENYQNNNTLGANTNNNSISNNSAQNTKRNDLTTMKEKQRVNDRLQDKLNVLKKHEQKVGVDKSRNSNERERKRERQNTNNSNSSSILLVKEKEKEQMATTATNSNNENIPMSSSSGMNKNKRPSSSKLEDKEKQKQRQKQRQKNTRVIHNNWIIDNHQMITDSQLTHHNHNIRDEDGKMMREMANTQHHQHQQQQQNNQQQRNSKSKLNGQKSVIIVKPHGGSSLDNKENVVMRGNQNLSHGNNMSNNNNNNNSRSSLRKVNNSQRKEDREKNNDGTAKFFRNEVADIISLSKGRSNSAKPQRKDSTLANTMTAMGLTKNGSLKAKGKWKF